MAQKPNKLTSYATQYISEVFENRLREEGFVCPDDNLLCWYRARNRELINSLIFSTKFSRLPSYLDIVYGIHPFFIKPVYNRRAYENKIIDPVRYRRQSIRGMIPNSFSGYCPFTSSAYPDRGFSTLENIVLPTMNRIQTIEDCYAWHKEYIYGIRNDTGGKPQQPDMDYLGHSWMDLLIYVDDKEMYPLQREAVNTKREHCMWKNIYDPQNMKDADEYLHWLRIESAMFGGNRARYLNFLEERKKENIAYLQKKLGVSIPE